MLTNDKNISLALAVWLATDDYVKREGSISVTTLMKPVRQIILSARAAQQGRDMDISNLVASRMGTAVHDSIEKAWLSPKLPHTLRALGYSESDIKRVRVNPPYDDVIGMFDVYVEQQMYKEFKGFLIKGQYDLILNGQLNDHKSTVSYMYLSGKNIPKYVLQGSIYRWMEPSKISNPLLQINYIFTDWSKLEAMKNHKYPQDRAMSEQYPMLSFEEVEKYLSDKIDLIQLHEDTPEPELPLCSDEDLWRNEGSFKYFADPTKANTPGARSTRTFDTFIEALDFMKQKGGIGIVKEFKGKARACNYCNAQNICSQRDALHASGELQPKP